MTQYLSCSSFWAAKTSLHPHPLKLPHLLSLRALVASTWPETDRFEGQTWHWTTCLSTIFDLSIKQIHFQPRLVQGAGLWLKRGRFRKRCMRFQEDGYKAASALPLSSWRRPCPWAGSRSPPGAAGRSAPAPAAPPPPAGLPAKPHPVVTCCTPAGTTRSLSVYRLGSSCYCLETSWVHHVTVCLPPWFIMLLTGYLLGSSCYCLVTSWVHHVTVCLPPWFIMLLSGNLLGSSCYHMLTIWLPPAHCLFTALVHHVTIWLPPAYCLVTSWFSSCYRLVTTWLIYG